MNSWQIVLIALGVIAVILKIISVNKLDTSSNIFDRINTWLDRSEVSWVTLLTKILPILVPIIPAVQTKYHVVSILGYEEWMGWAAAAIVEFFGYAAMYKMIQFAFKKAGFWTVVLAVVIYIVYLTIVLVFNVLPEVEQHKPDYIIWMNALFALLSVPAGALTAISAVHTEQDENKRAERERLELEEKERKEAERAERERLRMEKKEEQRAERERSERLRIEQEKTERERLRIEHEREQARIEQERANTRTPNTRTPERRTPAEQTPVLQPTNERKFTPYPNTENKHRIEQTVEQLKANNITPSVRNIQRALRIQDFYAVNNRQPTPEEEQTLGGWSTSTISNAMK